MPRREWSWTGKQFDKLKKVQQVLEELISYKPLTLRQIYYQLVGKGYIENKVSEYGMLSKLLKYARIEGYVGWDDIEDRGRVIEYGPGWIDKASFTQAELKNFLMGYKRHLVQDQNVFIEVWIEKDALRTIFARLTSQYCVSTVVCKGFSSVSFLRDFADRVIQAKAKGKHPIMLYFGDFDPSGNEMLPAMKETLETEFGITGIDFKRIALNVEDIAKYRLPHEPKALKRFDTRANKHIQKYGHLAVELDALHPQVLEDKLKNAIEIELDMNKFEHQKKSFLKEIEEITLLRDKVQDFIGSI